jgi:hypothetical protein
LYKVLEENPEMLKEIFESARSKFDCTAKLIKDLKPGEKPNCNLALYNLAVMMKIVMRLTCIRFAVEFTDDDSIETLFDKTIEHLPADILAMSEDVCYWYNRLQYKSADIKTKDETYEIAKRLERYFNEHTLRYANEIQKSIKDTTMFAVSIKPLSKF